MKFFQKFTRLTILFLFFPLSSQFILYVAKGILHTSMVYIHFNGLHEIKFLLKSLIYILLRIIIYRQSLAILWGFYTAIPSILSIIVADI
jgi:hypothetical protein